MKTTYNATAAEAARLHKGEQTMIVSIVKNQPQEGWEMRRMVNERGIFFEERKDTLYMVPWVRAPYLPGQDIVVRETMYELGRYHTGSFDETGEYETVWFSKGKFTPTCDGKPTESYRTISVATMPRSASRTNLVAGDTVCVRVHDVTQEQAIMIVGRGNCSPHRPASFTCPKHADHSLKRDCYYCEFKTDFMRKYQMPWETNAYIFLTEVKPR